MLDELVDYDAG